MKYDPSLRQTSEYNIEALALANKFIHNFRKYEFATYLLAHGPQVG